MVLFFPPPDFLTNVPSEDLLEPVCSKKQQKSSNQETNLGNREYLKVLKDQNNHPQILGHTITILKNDTGIHFFIFCSLSINRLTAKLETFSATCIQNEFWSSVRRHQRRKNSRWKRREINDTMNLLFELLAHFYACTILLKRIQF